MNSDYCADFPQEQRREIADAVHEESLKSVVVLWNSNRFPEEARAAAIERIAEEWGLRELLGSMAAWGTERMASNCRHLVQLFPCTTKTEYRQMAVWGADWAPFDDDVAGRWIRFCDAETVPADANAETVAALPKAEGRQWFCQRLDAIRQAIETYRIDAVFSRTEGSAISGICLRFLRAAHMQSLMIGKSRSCIPSTGRMAQAPIWIMSCQCFLQTR